MIEIAAENRDVGNWPNGAGLSLTLLPIRDGWSFSHIGLVYATGKKEQSGIDVPEGDVGV